jgi:hypothetical protein
MSQHPDADDYLRLFLQYGRDISGVYLEEVDEAGDRYRLLFEQVCALLVQASSFNLAMPQEFRRTAARWARGELATVAQMADPELRHFMLSDLHDYVHLARATGTPRR